VSFQLHLKSITKRFSCQNILSPQRLSIVCKQGQDQPVPAS
jgi:hypothetical protein